MKKILSICLCLGLLLGVSAYSKQDSKKDDYDEEKVVALATDIIKEMNNGDIRKS